MLFCCDSGVCGSVGWVTMRLTLWLWMLRPLTFAPLLRQDGGCNPAHWWTRTCDYGCPVSAASGRGVTPQRRALWTDYRTSTGPDLVIYCQASCWPCQPCPARPCATRRSTCPSHARRGHWHRATPASGASWCRWGYSSRWSCISAGSAGSSHPGRWKCYSTSWIAHRLGCSLREALGPLSARWCPDWLFSTKGTPGTFPGALRAVPAGSRHSPLRGCLGYRPSTVR